MITVSIDVSNKIMMLAVVLLTLCSQSTNLWKTKLSKWNEWQNQMKINQEKKKISFKYLVTKYTHTHTHTHTHTRSFIFKWNKPIWKEYTLYNSIYMTKAKLWRQKKDHWLHEVEHEGFLGQLNSSVWRYNGQHKTRLSKPIDCQDQERTLQ